MAPTLWAAGVVKEELILVPDRLTGVFLFIERVPGRALLDRGTKKARF